MCAPIRPAQTCTSRLLTLQNQELILWQTRGKDEANPASAAKYGVACLLSRAPTVA